MTYNVSMGTLNPTIPYHTWKHPMADQLIPDYVLMESERLELTLIWFTYKA